MSDVVHYSEVPMGVIPKRFLCGRKCKQSGWSWLAAWVDCPQCLAKLRDRAKKLRDAADESKVQK